MVFDEIKGRFGFGCMRLPVLENGDIDIEQFKEMVDTFIENGFNYFDTAHPYMMQRSEASLKVALTSRHKREEYLLANKLTNNFFDKNEDIRPLFQKQLDLCGVDYFDFYLMHAQNAKFYEHFKAERAYEECFKLKEEGKIRHLGMSFHDTPEVLDMILSEHPEIEFVQLQVNYLDMEAKNVQSRACLEVCKKHNKPVIVMEPLKGGKLANLPSQSRKYVDELNKDMSDAELAFRFVASHKNVFMILSGMNSLTQMQENVKLMKDIKELNEEEYTVIDKIVKEIHSIPLIGCTSCEYCTKGCPMNINIPSIFSVYNDKIMFPEAPIHNSYVFATQNRGKASDCIDCGQCESQCPQHLEIRKLLKEAANLFE